MLADPAMADLLDEAESDRANLDEWQHANLAEMRRQWAHATALNPRLVEALSKAASACEQVWRKARPAGDFALVKPALAELLARVREAAAAKAAKLGCSPYDALLDEYEPGGRAAEIDVVFGDLAKFLPEFRERALAHQAARPAPVKPAGPFPIEKQRALGEKLMQALGFDFDHGRLDISLHPFCGGVPDDVRITTRYYPDDFAHSLMAVIHETGHALYERGLPPDWRHQPVGQARGMSLHESQSLLMEMQACRSRPFVAFVAPLARETFGGNGPAWDEDNIHRLYTRVKPDFIRVDADEVTYPAHVILRYRLERALIAGDMELDDLPAAWNAGMKELLGHRAALRPRGLPAGHPLVRRRLGLLPDLHAGRHDRRPALRRRPPRQAGDSRGHRQGRLRAAAGLAARQRARPRLPPLQPRAADPRHRPPARSRGVQAASGDAVSELSGQGKR